jgi:hypothetical protein
MTMRVFHRRTTKLAVLLSAAYIAACAVSPTPREERRRAFVEASAVRSVFYPEGWSACRAAPCAGPVPAYYVAAFKRELAAAGFEVVEERGQAAPVVRIHVDHIATTPTECDLNGAVYVADTAIEIRRTYVWQRGAYATTFGAAADKTFSPELKHHILQMCLGAFAKAAKESLATAVSPGKPTASR